MTKTIRICGAATLAIIAMTLFASPSAAAAPRPVLSGTIEGGTGVIFAGEQPAGERWGCEYAAECRAWLKSKCKPALAGRDPALTASIVDVGALADGHTPRSFRWRAPAKVHPGALIQFWRQNCTEIPDLERHTHNPYSNTCGTCEPFPIPSGAKWMTVSANWTTVHFTWTLTPAETPPTRTERIIHGRYRPYPAPVTGCNRPLGSWACMIVRAEPTEHFVTVKVKDTHGLPVYFSVFNAGTGFFADFCGESGLLSLDQLRYMEIEVGVSRWVVQTDCPASSVKTKGKITVTLSNQR